MIKLISLTDLAGRAGIPTKAARKLVDNGYIIPQFYTKLGERGSYWFDEPTTAQYIASIQKKEADQFARAEEELRLGAENRALIERARMSFENDSSECEL